jgi:hypothetical protein
VVVEFFLFIIKQQQFFRRWEFVWRRGKRELVIEKAFSRQFSATSKNDLL